VVAGGTNSTEGVANLPQGNRVERGEAGTERRRGRFQRVGGNKRILVDPSDTFRRPGSAEAGKVALVVHQPGQTEVALGGVAPHQAVEARRRKGVFHRPDAVGALGMPRRRLVAVEIALRN